MTDLTDREAAAPHARPYTSSDELDPVPRARSCSRGVALIAGIGALLDEQSARLNEMSA